MCSFCLKPMGVNRKEVERIFKSRFVTNDGSHIIVLKGEKTDEDSIQNDIERIKFLTLHVLDRAHRFVRLWRKTSWSIEELDLVLYHLKDNRNSLYPKRHFLQLCRRNA